MALSYSHLNPVSFEQRSKLSQSSIDRASAHHFSVLKLCRGKEDLAKGKLVHARIRKDGDMEFKILPNLLVQMYADCGSLQDARIVFDRIARTNVFSWNIIIGSYSWFGLGKYALQLFNLMQEDNQVPDKYTFSILVNACSSLGNLERGKLIHAFILESMLEGDAVIGNALVIMYGKCASSYDACKLFEMMETRDLVSWNAIISVYVRHGYYKDVFPLFREMQKGGQLPDKFTFCSLLNMCCCSSCLWEGKLVHACILDRGFRIDNVVANALVNMYGKCGSVNDAWLLFHTMPNRTIITWNSMLAAFVQNDNAKGALSFFYVMQSRDVNPDRITCLHLLDACGKQFSMIEGKLIHSQFVHQVDVAVGTALLSMYGKCGCLEDARKVLEALPNRNAFTWTAMVSTYVQVGNYKEALQTFKQMLLECLPETAAFLSAIDACGALTSHEYGKWMHAHIAAMRSSYDITSNNALIDMYGKCGCVDCAEEVFDGMCTRDVVTWTAMISSYTQNLCDEEALLQFHLMQLNGILPNRVAFVCIVHACANLSNLEEGKRVHALIEKSGHKVDEILGAALTNMYGKSGSLDAAYIVFVRMSGCDMVSWNTIIAACCQNDHGREALYLFQQMQLNGIQPNRVTLVNILDACSRSAMVSEGRRILLECKCKDVLADVVTGNAIINMHAKCGTLKEAEAAFNNISNRNVVSWNVIISAYGQNGYGHEALQRFQQMGLGGIFPNSITFVNLLAACSHTGLMNQSVHLFVSMSYNCRVTPTTEHYGCLIDMFGRMGQWDKAEDFISHMTCETTEKSREMLLAFCNFYF